MTALPSGSSGVSCWFPNEDTRVVPRRHVGGRQFAGHSTADRAFTSHRIHQGCWEGEAECWQDDYTEQFRCGGCQTWITTWDYEDTLRDGGDVEPEHTDDDGLWQPESLERRGA